jgi:two-component system, OmpR family, phosphate regulon response regulator PhoB
MAKILCVDDEPLILELLSSFLRGKDYQVLTALNALEGLTQLQHGMPELIILDWMLPDFSGIEFVKKMRHLKPEYHVPVIFLTARSAEAERIKGLRSGAVDYMTKPVALGELAARIELRLSERKAASQILMIERLRLDYEAREASFQGQVLNFSVREFELLWHLAQKPGKVYSRQTLLDAVWSNHSDVFERTVDVHISRVRKLLGNCTIRAKIQSVRGIGYRLSLEEELQ